MEILLIVIVCRDEEFAGELFFVCVFSTDCTSWGGVCAQSGKGSGMQVNPSTPGMCGR